MMKPVCTAVALGVSALLSACAATDSQVRPVPPIARLQDMTISGKAAYRERIALLPGSTFDVRLLDISRADAPATVLAQDTRTLSGEQPPLTFWLKVKQHAIKTNLRYAVRATINDPSGRLAWTTDTIHLIDPNAIDQDLGTLTMIRTAP